MPEQIVQELNLNYQPFEQGAEQVASIWDKLDNLAKESARQSPFKKQAQEVLKFNAQLQAGSQLFGRLTTNNKAVNAEVRRLATEYVKAAAAQKQAASPGEFQKTQAEIKKLRAEIDGLSKDLIKANAQIDKLNNKKKSNKDSGGGLLGKIDVGGTVGQLASGAGLALGGAEIIRRAVTESAEYGRKLSELSSLTGAIGKDLAFLDQQAQNLEADTGIAASTILDTFKAVGSIQPELLTNKQLLADTTKEVVALAQAGSISLPEAAQATLGALNQFGEGADQASRFVNVLAAGALKGASEINDTTQALQNSGTAIKAAGLSFEQGNAIIQSLAGVMIKGSEAGTGLRNVLLKLETASDKNLRPSVVGLDKALENASKKYDTTTKLTKEFGVENIIAARRILDTRGEISKLTTELTGTDIAYQQQKTNLNNLATDLDKAGTATTGFFRTLGQSQDGFLRRITQGYTLFLQNITNAKSTFRAFIDGFTEEGLFQTLPGALRRGAEAAQAQGEANDVVRKREAQVRGIQAEAIKGVQEDTKALVELYTKQGDEVPKAQRKAAEKVQMDSDAALKAARTDHEKLRKEFERDPTNERFNDDFEQSRQRILRTQTAKQKADSELARLNKLDADRAKLKASADNEGPTEEEKKALKAAQDISEKLIQNKEKLNKALADIAEKFAGEELETLDKNSQAYIQRKREIDLKEIEDARQAAIKMGQALTARPVKNLITGQTTWENNMSYKLPKEIDEGFTASKGRVNAQADRDAGRLAEEQFEKDRLNITRKYRDGEEQYDRERGKKREQLQRDLNTNELLLQTTLNDETEKLIRAAGESEIDFEKRKQEKLLAVKLEYYEKALRLAEADPSLDPSVVQNLRNTIQGIKGELKSVQDQAKTGPQNLFQLLGLTFKDKDGKDVTSQVEKQVGEASQLAIDSINTVLNEQISADQAKIDSYTQQLEEKQREIDTEAELSRQGLANNLTLKREEYAAIEAQRKKAQESQRRDQQIQLGINATLQASELALAVAKIIRSYAGLPVIGQIAAGVEIIALFATFAATVARIGSLPKYHDGDEVTAQTARQRSSSGVRRSDEVDVRLQHGEGVTNKKSYQANKRLLQFLNTVDYPVALQDLAAYVRENPLEMLPDSQAQGLKQINQYYELKGVANAPDRDLHRRVDELSGHMKSLLEETRKGNRLSKTQLADGRIREVDEHGNVSVYTIR